MNVTEQGEWYSWLPCSICLKFRYKKCDCESGVIVLLVLLEGSVMMKRNQEPRVPDEASWRMKVSTPQGLGARHTLGSDSAGRITPDISVIDHSVDDIFIHGASTLSDLFKKQELISSEINSSLTKLCVQLKADSQETCWAGSCQKYIGCR